MKKSFGTARIVLVFFTLAQVRQCKRKADCFSDYAGHIAAVFGF